MNGLLDNPLFIVFAIALQISWVTIIFVLYKICYDIYKSNIKILEDIEKIKETEISILQVDVDKTKLLQAMDRKIDNIRSNVDIRTIIDKKVNSSIQEAEKTDKEIIDQLGIKFKHP